MRKIAYIILTITMLTLLAACGEEEEQISAEPVFEGLAVEGRDPVQDGELAPYRVEKNADITVELAFSNPDNVEFNTVRIEGTTYRAHRFSEDSTPTNLVLTLSAGRMTGEETYEVEEIEYIDEEGVKSISVAEDNAYTLFVMRSTPSAVFGDLSTDTESIGFEISVDDPDATLISATLEIIHEDEGVLEERSVTLDTDFFSYTFENLQSDTTYDLRIVADYETDDPEVDGGELQDIVIAEATGVTTDAKPEPVASILNPRVEETSFTFDLTLEDPGEVIETDSLRAEVYHDDELCGACEVDFDSMEDIRIDGLLNNNTYDLRIFVDYDLNDGEGIQEDVMLASTEFTTPEKELADITTDIDTLSENELKLNIDASTLYESVEVEHMMLKAYDSSTDTLLKETQITSRESLFKLSGLHADQGLRIVVEASYDLQDGQGYRQDIVHESTLRTPANEAPSVSISDVTLLQEGAEVNLNVNDPSGTLKEGSITLHLYEAGTDGPVQTFEGVSGTSALLEHAIVSEKAYTVEVEIDYDLRDDTGVKSGVKMDSQYIVATLDDKAPMISIDDIIMDSESVSVDYIILDNDGTIIEDGITLRVGDTEHTLQDLAAEHTVGSLFSNREYDISIEIEYDLGDGEGVRSLVIEDTVSTTAKTTPSVSIVDTDVNWNGLEYNLELEDPDSIATFNETRVLKDGTLIDTFTEGEAISGLLFDTAYTMEVVYHYDLNDGTGQETLIETFTFTTEAQDAPEVSLGEITATQEGFSFDYTFLDPDSVIDMDSLTFTYNSESEALATLEGTIHKDGLLSDTTYALTLEAEYDLGDGEGVRSLVIEDTVDTDARTEASAQSDGNTSEVGASIFEITIDDADETIVDGTLEAVLVNEAGDTLKTWQPSTGEVSLTHHALIYGETLTLTLTADIDLHDGESPEETLLLETTLEVPQYVTYDENTLSEDAFKGTLDLSELSAVITDFDTVESTIRYVDYDETIGQAYLSNQKLFYDVSGLLSDRDIELSVSATYDIGDGEETGVIYSTIIRTSANAVPTASLDITDFNADAGTIDFTAIITDPDSVRLDNSTYAKLYRQNSEGVMELYDTLLLDEEDNEYTFDGLDLDYREFYLIEIETDYYLRDGRGNHEAVNLDVDTVRIDVTPDAPESSITNVATEKGTVTFDVSVTDKHDTIEHDSLYAVLFENGTEVDRHALESHAESVTFSGLANDTEHTISVIADVDLKEASIREEETLDSHTFTSYDAAPDVSLGLDTDKGSLSADIAIADPDDTIDMDSLYAVLYENGVERGRQALDTLDENVTFTELQNNTAYTVTVEADVDYGEASIRTEEVLATESKSTPDVEAAIGFDEESTEHRIDIAISIDDPYDTIMGSEGTVRVLDESGTLKAEFENVTDGVEITLTELLSDHAYTFIFVADTDYHDGEGIVNRTLAEHTVNTDAYTEADATVTMDDVDHDSAEFTIGLDNPDALDADVTAIELHLDDALVDDIESPSVGSFTWSDLQADTAYEIVVTYEYDMLDGEGLRTGTTTETFTTDAYSEPTITIDDMDADENSVQFTVNETDPDDLNTIEAIELLMDDAVVDSIDDPTAGPHSFTDLYSDQSYTIRVMHSYDLSDGTGEQTATVTETFTTDALESPDIAIENQTFDGDDIQVDLSMLDDPDDTVSDMSLELWYDGELQETITPVSGNSTHTFEDVVMPDMEYTIILRADVDLNDANSPYEDAILDEVKLLRLS